MSSGGNDCKKLALVAKVTWHELTNEYAKKASTQRHAEEDHGVKVPGGKDVCTCQMPKAGKEQRSSTRYRNFIILLFLHNDLGNTSFKKECFLSGIAQITSTLYFVCWHFVFRCLVLFGPGRLGEGWVSLISLLPPSDCFLPLPPLSSPPPLLSPSFRYMDPPPFRKGF